MDSNCNVHVVDAIMGSGKTSAMINYMKENEGPFLFITPYLDEVKRIVNECSEKDFKEPKTINGRKTKGLKKLLNAGCNIASTHELFKRFDRNTIEIIKSHNYTLVLDEVASVIKRHELSKIDFDVLVDDFVDIDENGVMKWRKNIGNYNGKFFEEKNLCDLNSLVYYGGSVALWLFPIEAFTAFKNVFILTYMFESQLQSYYYKYYGINFDYVYVEGDSPENYRITTYKDKSKKVSCDYKSLIHILDNERMNSIGDGKHDLSKMWYYRNCKTQNMKQLKNNLINYFRQIRRTKSSDCIWTTFVEYKNLLSSKGFTKGFVALNMRATNEYRNRTSIAYVVNRFINPGIKNFFTQNGVEVDEDGYALSEMLQFIWRSAIRDGNEIWIYIPSIRMRNLLTTWMDKMHEEYISCNTSAGTEE